MSNEAFFGNYILSMLLKKIIIPGDFQAQVEAVKEMQRDDVSGLVDVLTDFSVESASVDFTIETDNPNLNEMLNKWLEYINIDLPQVPTGINPLAEEYFKERWKTSSFPILKMGEWENIGQDFLAPTKLFIVDGGSVYSKEINSKEKENVNIVNYIYTLGNEEGAEDLTKNSIITKPFARWYEEYPTPFLIKRGVYHNWKIINSLKDKQWEVLEQIIPYMMLIKKGSEGLAVNKDIHYSDEKLKLVIEQLETALDKYKELDSKTKSLIRATNFDEELKHLIPDLSTLFKQDLFTNAEKAILTGLGFIDVVDGATSSRRESILNPKGFIQETKKGVRDFKQLIKELLLRILKENDNHKKFKNTKFRIVASPVTGFMSDKFKERIKQVWDRGKISNKTATEIIAEVDFETEVKRREEEARKGIDLTMYPNVTENREGVAIDFPNGIPKNTDTTDEIPDEKVDPTEKKEFNSAKTGKTSKDDAHLHAYNVNKDGNGSTNSIDGHKHKIKNWKVQKTDNHSHELIGLPKSQLEGAPYKTIKELPKQVRENLNIDLQRVFMSVFNRAFDTYSNDTLAFRVAWSVIKRIAKRNKDGKWVRKAKKVKGKTSKVKLTKAMVERAIEESEQELIDEAFAMEKLTLSENKKQLLSKLTKKGKA